MQPNLIQLFDSFKSTSYYAQSSFNLDLAWIQEKLEQKDFEELEKQILAIILENEEELFINTLKYIWRLFKELSSDDI